MLTLLILKTVMEAKCRMLHLPSASSVRLASRVMARTLHHALRISSQTQVPLPALIARLVISAQLVCTTPVLEALTKIVERVILSPLASILQTLLPLLRTVQPAPTSMMTRLVALLVPKITSVREQQQPQSPVLTESTNQATLVRPALLTKNASILKPLLKPATKATTSSPLEDTAPSVLVASSVQAESRQPVPITPMLTKANHSAK